MATAELIRPMKKTKPHYLDRDDAPQVVDTEAAAKLLAKRQSAAADIESIISDAARETAEALAERDAKLEAYDVALENLRRAAAERDNAANHVRAISWRAEHATKPALTFLKETADWSIADVLDRLNDAYVASGNRAQSATGTECKRLMELNQRQAAAMKYVRDELWKLPLSADELAAELRKIEQECGL